MKKYLVDVYLPAIGSHFDAYLPAVLTIGEAIELLIDILVPLTRGGFSGSEETVLISANDGEPLDKSVTVHDSGIRNSSSLLLI